MCGAQPIDDVQVGEHGLAYTRARLAEGQSLARSVLDACRFTVDTCHVGLPPGTSSSVAKDLEHGGKLPRNPKDFVDWQVGGDRFRAEPVPNADEWLARKISKHLAGSRRNLCVFENSSAEPHYPWISRSGLRTLVYGNEVYHYLVHGDAGDTDFVAKTIRLARSWLFLGFLTALPSGTPLFTGTEILDDARMKDLQRLTRYVIVDAYGGESAVVCACSC
jgi:hypothetical protein